MAIQFPTLPSVCLCTTWEKQNQQNLTFLSHVVLSINQNNAQKHILFTFLRHWLIWVTFHPSIFSTAYSKTARNVDPLCEHRHGGAKYALK